MKNQNLDFSHHPAYRAPLPRDTYIVSLQRVWDQLKDRAKPLVRAGIDVQGLYAYAVHYAAVNSYTHPSQAHLHLGTNAVSHLYEALRKDLIEIYPDLLLENTLQQRLLFQCMDFVQEACIKLVPLIEQHIGAFDHTLRPEKFLGRDSLVLSRVRRS